MPVTAAANSAATPAVLPAAPSGNAPGNRGNTRTLRFKSVDLPHDISLMLMFTAPSEAGTLYTDMFPMCWKVINLPATGISRAKVVYTSHTAFSLAAVGEGNLVEASTTQSCETGQKCTITTNERGVKTLSVATPGQADQMLCFNETGRPVDVSIDFLNERRDNVQLALTWRNVANRSSVAVKLTPILHIYSAGNYKETQLLKGDVQAKELFSENLENLAPDTTWVVSIAEPGHDIKIEPEPLEV